MDQRKKAEKFANMIFRPEGARRPDRRQVLEFLTGQSAVDVQECSTWEKEAFVCYNGQTAICGEYYPVERAVGCAVLSHGFAQNRYIMIPQQKLFRELGFHTVLFDQRGFGESSERYCTFSIKEASDVACVAEWARKKSGLDGKIVVLGVSMGAAAAMKALDYTEHINYLIEDCGFADLETVMDTLYASMNEGETNIYAAGVFKQKAAELGLDTKKNQPIDAIGKTEIPVCIFHGTGDTTIDAEHARRLYGVCRNPDSRLELFEGKEHALCVTDTERYRRVLRKFLDKLM